MCGFRCICTSLYRPDIELRSFIAHQSLIFHHTSHFHFVRLLLWIILSHHLSQQQISVWCRCHYGCLLFQRPYLVKFNSCRFSELEITRVYHRRVATLAW
ncbi:hypothetical protein Pmani_004911 [Petrolisthes manimaculis]|uniref:Uncharacterized protein n=1 Tax=Petrolisthes manimaculis TaxID=1843537 RepID=A0AAE1QEZ7_9EUCA|nr:hypothetical protein Pmani_004911 [Petrolisthes manimaculis]